MRRTARLRFRNTLYTTIRRRGVVVVERADSNAIVEEGGLNFLKLVFGAGSPALSFSGAPSASHDYGASDARLWPVDGGSTFDLGHTWASHPGWTTSSFLTPTSQVYKLNPLTPVGACAVNAGTNFNAGSDGSLQGFAVSIVRNGTTELWAEVDYGDAVDVQEDDVVTVVYECCLVRG